MVVNDCPGQITYSLGIIFGMGYVDVIVLDGLRNGSQYFYKY